MADEKNADRSSIEIKSMLRKLHPDRGNHKDRIRRLNKFRNFVTGEGSVSPLQSAATQLEHACALRAEIDEDRLRHKPVEEDAPWQP